MEHWYKMRMHHRDTESTEMKVNKMSEQVIGAAIVDPMIPLCPLCLRGEMEVL